MMSAFEYIVVIFSIASAFGTPWQNPNFNQNPQYSNYGNGLNNNTYSYYDNQENHNSMSGPTPTTTKPLYPTLYPQIQPTAPINSGYNPVQGPSYNPSYNPTQNPAQNPSYNPSYNPTQSPPYNPFLNPSLNPPHNPSYNPAQNPPYNPFLNSSLNPPHNPSHYPAQNPSYNPTQSPSLNPARTTPYNPFLNPPHNPSHYPAQNPSNNPSYNPTNNSSYRPSYPGLNQRMNGENNNFGNRPIGYNSTTQRNINNQNNTLNPNQNLNNHYNNNAFGGIPGSSNPIRPTAQGTPQYNNDRNNQWPIGGRNPGFNNNNVMNGYNNRDNLNIRGSAPSSFDTDPNGIPLASIPTGVGSNINNNLFNYNNLHQRSQNQNFGANVPLAPFPGQ